MKYDELINGLEDLYEIVDYSDEWFGGDKETEQKSRNTISKALKVLRKLNAQSNPNKDKQQEHYLHTVATKVLKWADVTDYDEAELWDLIMLELFNIDEKQQAV